MNKRRSRRRERGTAVRTDMARVQCRYAKTRDLCCSLVQILITVRSMSTSTVANKLNNFSQGTGISQGLASSLALLIIR